MWGMPNLQGITKHNYASSKGYAVRLGWFKLDGRNYPEVSKFFSKIKYKTWQKALAAAVAFRDSHPKRVAKERPIAKPGGGTIKRVTVRSKSRSGEEIVGDYFVAWIRVSPKHTQATKWSIDRWGRTVALRRTQEWLKKKRAVQRSNYLKYGVHIPMYR